MAPQPGRRVAAVCVAAWLELMLTGSAAPGRADSLPAGFVHLAVVDASIRQDMRYFTGDNFIGRRVEGYEAGTCILTRHAAEGLARVQQRLLPTHSLKVLDCYRPARAVADFVTWAADLADQKAKAHHYPTLDKRHLHDQGYISRNSAHSRGSAVDLTIVALSPPTADGVVGGSVPSPVPSPCGLTAGASDTAEPELDFGTSYDCFHALSHTANPSVGRAARRNRDWLIREMALAGFRNYHREWWHFQLVTEPFQRAFDFPVIEPAE